VEFGQKPAAGDLVTAVNEVLATFRAAPPEGTYGYKTQADIDDGLSIRIPEPWTFHQDPSGPDDPRTLFAVGSWTFTVGGECAPVAAQEELPVDGTLFWLIEYVDVADPSEFPARPEHFELDEDTYAQFECSLVPSYLIRFQDKGRYFQAHVAFGPEAPESLGPEVLSALESLEVIAPVPDECPDDTGPWSDPDCPLPAWTRAVVEEAGYEVTGDTGSALVARAAGSGIYIWTNEQEELGSEPTFTETLEAEGYERWGEVAGRTVFTDGIRAVWVVQGLRVWVEGGPVDDLPELDVVAPLVEASEAVDYDAIDTR
jgi:hypothetical protein